MRLRIFAYLALTLFFIEAFAHASPRARMRAETVLNDAAVRISAGAFHTCQVKDDGTVFCWGTNVAGQVGNGSGLMFEPTPVQVTGISGAIAVAAGAVHSCALLGGGTVRCWGDNASGQLGDNSRTNRLTPVAVVGLTNAVAISAGKEHTCAVLGDSTVRCWGSNTDGKLGDLTTTLRLTPVTVLNINATVMGNVVSIAAGAEHTCALFATGTARCWGNSANGRLGFAVPGGIVSGLVNAVAIAAGSDFTCALIAGGFVSCWGGNSAGQLGNNSTVQQPFPVLAAGLPTAASITAGPDHACVIIGDGTARCWGNNLLGQVGDGTSGQNRLTGVPVTGLNNAVAIAAGGFFPSQGHACALLADGSARCWGTNGFGQLGNGTLSPSLTPIVVLGGGGSVTARAIAAGRNHTCAVRGNSTVSCWGSNGSGQIGDGTSGTNRLSPVLVPGLTNVVGIAAGEAHTCAVVADGSVRCWGDNSSGQLGDGTFTPKSSPVPVPGLFHVIGIAAGGALGSSHTCALTAEGGVFCWGSNGSGQLGDGTNTPRPSPVLVHDLSSVVSIAVGELYSCGLLANGTARCWGANNTGQLGDGTNTPKSLPVAVFAENNLVALTAGNTHACALLANGSGRCWGGNLLGQLGDNSHVTKFAPVAISGLANAVAIAGGFGHTCAALGSGGVMCWGDNSSGQLGNATTTPSITPVVAGTVIQGIGITLFRPIGGTVNITAGRRHTCTRNSAGAVLCWGDNTSGQVGINSTNSQQNSPALVPSFIVNIDAIVTLAHNSRVATVTILASCEPGQRVFVNATLTQGAVSGNGAGAGDCTGGLERYEVAVGARGPDPWSTGPARVSAEAVIRDGHEVENQEWTRQVNIVSAP